MTWPRSSERSMSLWTVCCGMAALSFPGQHRTVACLRGHKMQWDNSDGATSVLFDHTVHRVLRGIADNLVFLVSVRAYAGDADEGDAVHRHHNEPYEALESAAPP